MPSGESATATPINFGLPNVELSNIQGLSEQQPSFSVAQTISLSETLSWIHGKHNLRFGGDYRRVHRDFLAGSNATGSFTFTGLFTQDANNDQATGTPLADFLLGYPQQTTLNSVTSKSYLRDNVFDVYVQDDWRALPSVTLNYGVRYEYFAPYTEKYGHLGEVLTNPGELFTSQSAVTSGGAGRCAASLVYPYRTAFAPRHWGWRGKGSEDQADSGARRIRDQLHGRARIRRLRRRWRTSPPFANEQTNQEEDASARSRAEVRYVRAHATNTCYTLANGFPAPATIRELRSRCRTSTCLTCKAWNLDIQKTLPWGIVGCERGIQRRIEGQSFGHRDRAAGAWRAVRSPIQPICSFAMSRLLRFRSSAPELCA